MAFDTIVAKLPIVDVFMASHTLVFRHIGSVLENHKGIGFVRMAAKTIDFLVGTPKVKVCAAVIKHPLSRKLSEGGLCMTLGAGSRELPIMRIFMAGYTVIEGNSAEFLEFLAIAGGFFVAAGAIHILVCPLQRIFGIVVVKVRNRCKAFHGMAFQALVREGLLVVVFMAVQAGLSQA